MNIPGGQSCPNAELLHRLPMLRADPEVTIVVSCAGRTRSIIGAQSLLNSKPANNIFALENGTQGWCLAGLELERGTDPGMVPTLDEAALTISRDRAVTLMSRFEIPQIDRNTLAGWQRDEARTVYLFDVRTAEEFADGHLTAALHAPGDQLVQATDQWVAVKGARIVLTDDTGLRAANTALWLRSMGHDAYVLDHDVSACEAIAEPPQEALTSVELPATAAEALSACLADGAQLLDLSPSLSFREAHIEEAVWAIRPRLDSLNLNAECEIILASRTQAVAELAAIDLREQGLTQLSRLDGTPDD